MKRLITILAILIVSVNCLSQSIVPRANSSYTVMDSRFMAQYNLFAPRYADTTAANAGTAEGIDTLGAVIFTYNTMSLWVRSGDPKSWVEIGTGGGITQAALNDTAAAIRGDFPATPGIDDVLAIGQALTANRNINLSSGTTSMNMQFGRQPDPWTHEFGEGIFNLVFTDTIKNPDTQRAWGLNAHTYFRSPSYASSIYRLGHNLQVTYESADSVRLNSYGGDFGEAVRSNLHFKRLSGYTGKSVYMIGNLSMSDVMPVHLANLDWGDDAASTTTNYKYVRGYMAGFVPYLVTRPRDTVDNWMGVYSKGFLNTNGYVGWTADFVGGFYSGASASLVGKNWFLWNNGSNSWHKGGMYIGDSTLTSSALLNVSSTSKGVVFPRMTGAQQNAISSPETGLLIYNTDSLAYCFYNGTAWLKLNTGSGGGGTGSNLSYNSGTHAIDIDGGGTSAVIPLANTSTTGLITDTDWDLFNEKAPTASPTFTGTITTPLTASRAVVTGASNELAVATTTATEIGYVNGVTSSIQTQLNNKVTISGTPADNQIGVWTSATAQEGGANLTWNGTLLDVTATAAASTGEQIFKMQVSDDANSYFSIDNITTVDSRLIPAFIGEVGTNSVQNALFFIGRVTAGIETGTTPIMVFDSRRTTAAATTRPLFDWRNFGTSKMLMTAVGNVGVGTTAPDGVFEVNLGTAGSLRLSYNDANGSAANRFDVTVASTGSTTLNATGTSPTITVSDPLIVTSGIVGTTTNDAATAGNVGQEINSTVSTYTNFTTTATYQNITSIALTAGDWDISAFFTYSSNSATITAASNAIFVISTTTASAAGATEGQNIAYVPQAALLGTSLFSEVISPYRVSISGTTTYYLNAQATFTLGNPQYVGSLRARRIR